MRVFLQKYSAFDLPPEWQVRLSRMLMLVLIVLLAISVSRLFWSVIAAPRPINLEPQPLLNRQVSTSSDLLAFMNGPTKRAARLPADLQLIGVFLSSEPGSSSAVFRSGGETMRVAQGGMIGATEFLVGQVEWERAEVLSQTGASNWLDLTRTRMELNQPRASTNLSSSTPESVASSFNSQLQNRFNRASRDRREPKAANPTMGQVQEQLARFKAAPDQYLSEIGVAQNGGALEITSAVSPQLRSTLGLMPGDQVLSINDQPATQVANDPAAVEQIEMAGQARIQIQRGAQQITLNPRF